MLSERYRVYVETEEKFSRGWLCLKIWKCHCVLKLIPLFHGLWKGALLESAVSPWQSQPVLGKLAATRCPRHRHRLLPAAKRLGWTLNILLLIQRPLISWGRSLFFCGNSPGWGSAPEITVCGLSRWPWLWAQLCGRGLATGASSGRREAAAGPGSQLPAGQQAQPSLRVRGGGMGMTSAAHLVFAFLNITLALAFCQSHN